MTGEGDILVKSAWTSNTKPQVNAKNETVKIKSWENAEASARAGLDIFEEGESLIYEIPVKLLGVTGKGSIKGRAFRIRGNSMEPTLPDNGIAIMDIEDTNIRSGCIYLIRQNGVYWVKRLNHKGKSIELISDNPIYGKIEIRPEDGEITVLGRIITAAKLT